VQNCDLLACHVVLLRCLFPRATSSRALFAPFLAAES
jgi:hypothetical protein